MRSVLVVASRELRAYFLQPLAWVVATAFLAVEGLFAWLAFEALSRSGGTSSDFVRAIFLWLPFLLLLLTVVCALAMRLFAEERRSGTLEALLTAPVTEAAVVAGKFLAAYAVYLLLWGATAVNVAFLALFRESGGPPLDLGPVAGGYLALALIGALFLSAGMLASLLTRNQIIAAVLAFLASLVLLIGPELLRLRWPGGAAVAVLDHLSLLDLLEEFSRGIVSLGRIVYPASVSLLLLYASSRLLEVIKGRTA